MAADAVAASEGQAEPGGLVIGDPGRGRGPLILALAAGGVAVVAGVVAFALASDDGESAPAPPPASAPAHPEQPAADLDAAAEAAATGLPDAPAADVAFGDTFTSADGTLTFPIPDGWEDRTLITIGPIGPEGREGIEGWFEKVDSPNDTVMSTSTVELGFPLPVDEWVEYREERLREWEEWISEATYPGEYVFVTESGDIVWLGGLTGTSVDFGDQRTIWEGAILSETYSGFFILDFYGDDPSAFDELVALLRAADLQG